ncbi:hypothetical protein OsccyDRAFT_0991 [Leptolyngbyaceae cyanobacterium JSC-12]|nr:hypothetical protein OsccyDRAFT_0991 [Leptolyngbyaceae cyanobacterium JSC-12]
MTFTQAEFNLRCEWGVAGITQLAPISDVVVIVDVLSFSISVDIATCNGAIAFPYCWKDDSALAYAQSLQAELAGRDRASGYSLSPQLRCCRFLPRLAWCCLLPAEAAIAAFHQAKDYLAISLANCGSGKELIARGFAADVELASQLNVSDCIPRLVNHAYINQSRDRVI